MEVLQVLRMNKGEGETSYAENSIVQRKIISVANSVIEEALVNMLCNNNFPESLGIADLGCSSGPNTLFVISEIIDMVHATTQQLDHPLPELRVSLNDLPGNDFNQIFVSLPAFFVKLKMKIMNKTRKGFGSGLNNRCFISGVPGSFYGRLFPLKSLHFVHSSSSLHWLSQVPPALASNAINKGKIYISRTSPSEVRGAYFSQFQKDFSLFIKSRSQEIVPGGSMVLSFMGRRSEDPAADEGCYQWELLAQALMSMALEGFIEKAKIDNFNVPYYAPCPKELKSELQKGSFMVERLEAFEIEWDGCEQSKSNFDSTIETLSRGEQVAKTIRAVVESMLESHFGREIMDELFRRYSQIVDDHLSKTRGSYINLVLSLVKKD